MSPEEKSKALASVTAKLYRLVDVLSPVASDTGDPVVHASAQILATIAGVLSTRFGGAVSVEEPPFDASDFERPHHKSCLCADCNHARGMVRADHVKAGGSR